MRATHGARCHDDWRTLTVNHGSADLRDQHIRTSRSSQVDQYRSSKLAILSPALLTEKTAVALTTTTLSRMTGEAARPCQGREGARARCCNRREFRRPRLAGRCRD